LRDHSAREKLIIALDVESAVEARRVFDQLRGQAGMFKIGPRLFTTAGPTVVREIIEEGGRIFLDLKFHDIPDVVAAACAGAARLGVSLLTVHAAGGGEMLRRAAEACAESASREGTRKPDIVGVTVLTSSDEATLAETGVQVSSTVEQVTRLARLAAGCGADGVVASPREIAPVREAVRREGFIIVTPGVRPRGTGHDDQKRVMTPGEAVRAGADYLVVGRAILRAPDPSRAAQAIIEEMEEAAKAAAN
jgi:orotidine-5'-phosphate decarboxylase